MELSTGLIDLLSLCKVPPAMVEELRRTARPINPATLLTTPTDARNVGQSIQQAIAARLAVSDLVEPWELRLADAVSGLEGSQGLEVRIHPDPVLPDKDPELVTPTGGPDEQEDWQEHLWEDKPWKEGK